MAKTGKKQPAQDGNSSKDELIRRFKANPVIFIGTVVILVIVIVVFVMVPAIVPAGEAGSAEDLNFGYYNKVPITYIPGNYFSNIQGNLAAEYQKMMDGSDTDVLTLSIRLWRQAFEETVVHIGILDELKRAKYTVPSELVDKQVALQLQENGRFSPALYQQLDHSTRLNLWRQMQEGLAQERYENDITGLRTPEAETKFIVSMGAPRRSFDFAVFPIDDYPDSELAAYAVQNPDLFLITHLSKITITSNERDARQILASVRDGTSTFEDAAKTHSKDAYAEKGGDMGVRPANELSIEISDAADMKSLIDLEAGELSELVKVPAGWAFFRAEDEPRVSDAGDSAVLQKIRSYVWQYERGRMEDWALGKAEAFLGRAAAEGFEEALDAEGIEKKQAGPLPINYGGVELFSSISSFPVEGLEEAASNENFWRLAFFTPLNTPSAPIVLGRYIFIIYPTEELGADESTAGYIESYANYFLSLCTGRSIRSFFLNSDKLEDRFQDAFLRHFLTSN